MIAGFHIGRSFEGHPIEDECPCPQEPCGLVDLGKAVEECDHHHPMKAKSTRQGHRLAECPGESAAAPASPVSEVPGTRPASPLSL